MTRQQLQALHAYFKGVAERNKAKGNALLIAGFDADEHTTNFVVASLLASGCAIAANNMPTEPDAEAEKAGAPVDAGDLAAELHEMMYGPPAPGSVVTMATAERMARSLVKKYKISALV